MVKNIDYKLEYVKVKGKEGLQYVARIGGLTLHSPDPDYLEKFLKQQGYKPKHVFEKGVKIKRARIQFG